MQKDAFTHWRLTTRSNIYKNLVEEMYILLIETTKNFYLWKLEKMSLQCIFKTLCCCSLKTNERKQRILQKVCLDKSSVIIIYFSVVFQLNDCVKVQI